jgi:hypothetical protein
MQTSSLPRPLLKACGITSQQRWNIFVWSSAYNALSYQVSLVGLKLYVWVGAIRADVHGVRANTIKAGGKSDIDHLEAGDGDITNVEGHLG